MSMFSAYLLESNALPCIFITIGTYTNKKIMATCIMPLCEKKCLRIRMHTGRHSWQACERCILSFRACRQNWSQTPPSINSIFNFCMNHTCIIIPD
jgi:hypothetical protein